jgi:hypothetical protein
MLSKDKWTQRGQGSVLFSMMLLFVFNFGEVKGQCGTNGEDGALHQVAVLLTQEYIDLFADAEEARHTAYLRVFNGCNALNDLYFTLDFVSVYTTINFCPKNFVVPNYTGGDYLQYSNVVNSLFLAKWPCLGGLFSLIVMTPDSGHGHGSPFHKTILIGHGFSAKSSNVAHELSHRLGYEHTNDNPDCASLCSNLMTAPFMCSPGSTMVWSSCEVHSDIFNSFLCSQLQGTTQYIDSPDFICPSIPIVSIETNQPFLMNGCNRSISKYQIKVTGGENSISGLSIRVQYHEMVYDVDVPVTPTPDFDFNKKFVNTANFSGLRIFKDDGVTEYTFNLEPYQERVFYFWSTFKPDAMFTPTSNQTPIDIALYSFNNQIAASKIEPKVINPVFGNLNGGGNASDGLFLTNDVNFIHPGTIQLPPLIIVDKGKRINIGAFTTVQNTFLGTTIEGCDEMWKGITLENGASLKLQNSKVKDAQIAIAATQGTVVDIKNCIFKNNNMGIVTGTSMSGDYNIRISGSKFYSDPSTFKPSYNNQNPLPLNKSFCGLLLTKVNNGLVLGDGNSFDNLKYGILSYNSTLNINNAVFNNISAEEVGVGYWSPTSSPSGKAIYASGGTLIANNNNFNVVHTGIETSNSSLTAESNTITGAVRGIQTIGKQPIKINSNTIGAKQSGIYFFSTSSLPKTVSDNIITMSEDEKAVGIRGAGSQYNSLGGTKVFGNQVTMNNGKIGIELTDFSNLTADNNYVSLNNEENKIGISIAAGQNLGIKCNNTTSIDNKNFIGIKAMHCATSNFNCNTTPNTHVGMQFEGVFSGNKKTSIAGNTMRKNGIGLLLGTDATVGLQDNQGNKWEGTFSVIGAEHLGDASASQFIVDAVEDARFLPSTYAPFDWFLNNYNPATSYKCSEITCPINQFFQSEGEQIKTISKGELVGTQYQKINNWIAQRRLLKGIQTEGNPLPNDEDVNTFITKAETNGLAANVAVQTGIRQAFNIGSDDLFTLQTYEDKIKGLLHSIRILQGNLNTNCITPMDSLSWATELNVVHGKVKLINEEKEAKLNALIVPQLTAVNTQINKNNELLAFETWEQYEKAVQNIFLNSIGTGTLALKEEQKRQLENIAALCPLSEGEAVLSARAILSIFETVPTYWNDDEYCKKGIKPRNQEESLNDTQLHLRLYPNPTDKTLTIDYNDFPTYAAQKILIHNVYGQLIREVKLDGQRGSVDVNVANLSEGIYYYYVPSSSKLLFSGKLVITH